MQKTIAFIKSISLFFNLEIGRFGCRQQWQNYFLENNGTTFCKAKWILQI